MRVLASGDNHFHGATRFAECIAVHEWMVELARRERPDVFLDGGDIYELASTPEEREAVAEWLTCMAEVCPVLITRGNHDREMDAEIMRRLRTKHGVFVESRAAVHHLGGAAIAAVAWPDRAQMVAAMGAPAPSAAIDDVARHAMQNVLRALGDELEQHDGPRILMGHFMVDGSIASTGQPLLGMPMNVGIAELALARPHLCLMGHIHKYQQWEHDGVPYIYVGSPYRTDFGQAEPKVVMLCEFEGQRLARMDAVETPATPMVHLDGAWTGSAFFGAEGAEVRGAEVRFRYEVDADHRANAKAAEAALRAQLADAGAKSVKLEAVTATHNKQRAPEVARATTLRGKLLALWATRGTTPDDERQKRLLDKAEQLELEAAS